MSYKVMYVGRYKEQEHVFKLTDETFNYKHRAVEWVNNWAMKHRKESDGYEMMWLRSSCTLCIDKLCNDHWLTEMICVENI